MKLSKLHQYFFIFGAVFLLSNEVTLATDSISLAKPLRLKVMPERVFRNESTSTWRGDSIGALKQDWLLSHTIERTNSRVRMSHADNVQKRNIKSPDDIYWEDKGFSVPGIGGTAYAMTVFNGKLIVAGALTVAGNVLAKYIAAWDGTEWSTLGTGMDSTV